MLVANERSGTVSIVDIPGRKVIREFPVGKHLSDLVAVPDVENAAPEAFLCADSAADELRLLLRRGNEIAVGDSLSVGSFPVSVCVDSEGKRGYVASLWSRRLTSVDLVRDGTGTIHLKAASVVALPFPPRLQTLTPDGKRLIVAGELAVSWRLSTRRPGSWKRSRRFLVRTFVAWRGVAIASGC